MWVDLCLHEIGKAGVQQGVGSDGRRGSGQQAPEGVCAVAGQFHQIGDLCEAGLNPVAPLGDDLLQDGGHPLALIFGGRTRTAVPRAACCAANALPLNPLSASRSRGGGPASSRSCATSRSLTAAGTMLQARTMRLPRSVLIASRKP